jgi:CheY-like chemotaxis protein
MVILVVEDEPLVRIFVADFMSEIGFKVLEAVDADEAMTILKARPDVLAIISDVEMPRGSMSGFALARAVRERWPGIGIVITSGRERPGPDELPEDVVFLAKPYLPETVIQVIQQIVTPQVVVEPPSALRA